MLILSLPCVHPRRGDSNARRKQNCARKRPRLVSGNETCMLARVTRNPPPSAHPHSGIDGTRSCSTSGRSNPKWSISSARSAPRSASCVEWSSFPRQIVRSRFITVTRPSAVSARIMIRLTNGEPEYVAVKWFPISKSTRLSGSSVEIKRCRHVLPLVNDGVSKRGDSNRDSPTEGLLEQGHRGGLHASEFGRIFVRGSLRDYCWVELSGISDPAGRTRNGVSST